MFPHPQNPLFTLQSPQPDFPLLFNNALPHSYLQLVTVACMVIGVRHRRLHGLHDGADLALDLFSGGRRLFSQFLLRLYFLRLGIGGCLAFVRVNPVLPVFLDELHQVFHGAGTRVRNRIRFVAGREQFDGGETLNLIRNIIGRRINFGDDHFGGKVGVTLVQKTKFFVFGSEPDRFQSVNVPESYQEFPDNLRFAMTTPWRIELQQNVLGVIQNNVIIIVRNDHRDRTVLLLRDGLRLDAGFDLAVHKVLNKGADGLLGDRLALVEGKLLVLDCLLNGKGRPLLLEVEITCVSTKGFRINGGKVNDPLVLLGDRLQRLR